MPEVPLPAFGNRRDLAVWVGESHAMGRGLVAESLGGMFPTEGLWTRAQLKLAFHVYCQTPFGQFDLRNKKVQALAALIGRKPGAVAMKLSNFASLDPAMGGKGLGNASQLDREIWAEFHDDWDGLEAECAQLEAHLLGHRPTAADPTTMAVEFPADFTGDTRRVMVEQRRKQGFFRRSVLSSYQARCCISGLSDERLLVASHIVAWSEDKTNRLNPRNGLCLSALHDRAFDAHLLTVDAGLRVVVSERLLRLEDPLAATAFSQMHGKSIALPERFHPDPAFLAHHRERFLQKTA